MEICKYCKKEAFFPPKTKWGGWCCVESFYKCPGYKEKLKKSSNPWNRGKIGLFSSWNKGIESHFKGKTHKIEVKQKISNSMKGNRNANHRGDRQSFYNGIRMDSKWEVGAAAYFNKNNIKWKYSERGFKLSDGRYYYPDFFIYDNDDVLLNLIEIKGFFREENKRKFELFLNNYPNIKIELWDKGRLLELGIINKSGKIK